MIGPWESTIQLCDMGIWFITNLCAQKSVQNFRTRLRDKGMFIVKRLRKGCNSTAMNFRDMGPFENPLVTHGNIGFNISGPPGILHKNSLSLCKVWKDLVIKILYVGCMYQKNKKLEERLAKFSIPPHPHFLNQWGILSFTGRIFYSSFYKLKSRLLWKATIFWPIK